MLRQLDCMSSSCSLSFSKRCSRCWCRCLQPVYQNAMTHAHVSHCSAEAHSASTERLPDLRC